jgi:hypothetical protein
VGHSPALTEAAIQRSIFAHLAQRGAPGVFAFHPANGGWRSPTEAAIFKGMGVVAGVPDIIVIHKGKVYGLELKSAGGRITAAQTQTLAKMAAAGANVGVAYSLDEALDALAYWGLLRGQSQ